MTLMLIISVLLVASVMGVATWRMKCLPDSISATVFVFKYKWLWTVWLVFVDVLTFAPVIEILDRRGLGILGFLPMAMLGFVAVWPLFDIEHRKWHYILAIAAGILSQKDVWFISPWCLLTWLLMPAAWIWTTLGKYRAAFDSKGVLLSEVICYVAVIGSEITYILSN
jgi:hypothetical protein